MSAAKDLLRGEIRRKRAAQSLEGIKASSQIINQRAIALIDWSKVRRLHCYRALPREVDTSLIVDEAAKHGVVVTIPTQDVRIPSQADLQAGYEVIIVPMLAFDLRNNRLGYGSGFYDRLMKAYPAAQKIGLCFELGRYPRLPIEPHDVPVDTVITES